MGSLSRPSLSSSRPSPHSPPRPSPTHTFTYLLKTKPPVSLSPAQAAPLSSGPSGLTGHSHGMCRGLLERPRSPPLCPARSSLPCLGEPPPDSAPEHLAPSLHVADSSPSPADPTSEIALVHPSLSLPTALSRLNRRNVTPGRPPQLLVLLPPSPSPPSNTKNGSSKMPILYDVQLNILEWLPTASKIVTKFLSKA